jgi:Mg2+/Co2+ transporter CorB
MEEEDRVIGVLPREMAIRCMGLEAETGNVCEIAGNDFVAVSEEATLFYVLARMRAQKASVALVTKAGVGDVVSYGDVKGVITRQQIGEAMVEGIELFAD